MTRSASSKLLHYAERHHSQNQLRINPSSYLQKTHMQLTNVSRWDSSSATKATQQSDMHLSYASHNALNVGDTDTELLTANGNRNVANAEPGVLCESIGQQ
jgi:hypothetical protein